MDTNATISRDCAALAERLRAYVWEPSSMATFFSMDRVSGRRFERADRAADALRDLVNVLLPDAPTPPLTEAQEAEEAARRA
jgi:hypothetical protein